MKQKILSLGLLLAVGISPVFAAEPGLRDSRGSYKTEVSITVEGEFRVIKANGIPDHETGQFPGKGNPNTISPQKYDYRVPLHPKVAEKPSPYRMQPFGIAVNGVVFDPGAAEWWNNDRNWQYEPLMAAPNFLGTDSSHAHVQPTGAYHYHGVPVGLIHALTDGKQKMVIVGWAADGFPIYNDLGLTNLKDARSTLKKLKSSYKVKSGNRNGGPGGAYDGKFVVDYEYAEGSGDLDECNGITSPTPEYPEGIYHYVLTDQFPYIPRVFKGTPDASFERRGPGGGAGGGAGGGGRPGGNRPGANGGGQGGPGPGFDGKIHVIPAFAIEAVKLSPEQLPLVEVLDKEAKEKLEKILTPDQMKSLLEARPPMGGMQGGRPGGGGGSGGRPGNGPQGNGPQNGQPGGASQGGPNTNPQRPNRPPGE